MILTVFHVLIFPPMLPFVSFAPSSRVNKHKRLNLATGVLRSREIWPRLSTGRSVRCSDRYQDGQWGSQVQPTSKNFLTCDAVLY